jgi:hypothetical protein
LLLFRLPCFSVCLNPQGSYSPLDSDVFKKNGRSLSLVFLRLAAHISSQCLYMCVHVSGAAPCKVTFLTSGRMAMSTHPPFNVLLRRRTIRNTWCEI